MIRSRVEPLVELAQPSQDVGYIMSQEVGIPTPLCKPESPIIQQPPNQYQHSRLNRIFAPLYLFSSLIISGNLFFSTHSNGAG